MDNFLVATIKSWNIENFYKYTKHFTGKWYIISKKEDFTLENLDKIDPKKIFIPHWSWIIPKEIFQKYECVLFHMTDLPYGRGGSPLQNLIVRGIYDTKISAIRIMEEVDAGDIYLKKPLNIEFGTAEEIFKKASDIIYEMIEEILNKNIKTIPQQGEIVRFSRRKPEDGNMEQLNDIKKIYDYVRMLNGEGYPRAFFEIKNIKYEFYNPILKNEELETKVLIKKKDNEG